MAIQAPVGSIWYTDPNQTVGTYPFINVKQTESGHFLLMDDTVGKETIILQHGKTGTQIQMLPNGDYEHRVYGNTFSIIVNDQNVIIQGICNIEVHGDSKLHVYGDSNMQIDGSIYAKAGKDAFIHTEGKIDVSSNGPVNITAGGSIPGIANDITLITGGSVNVKGDLVVSGKVIGGSISSNSNLTAATKIFAGTHIETLGEMNCGYTSPSPVPAFGKFTSTTSVTSPITVSGIHNGGVVSDVLGSMSMMRAWENLHIHTAPSSGGPTSPPTVLDE